jgi:Phospholipase_D-nuclease N-terminal
MGNLAHLTRPSLPLYLQQEIVIGIFGSIFWIWMLIDCLTKEPDEGNTKLAWALTIVFLHFIGSSLYYFIRRPERMRKYGR